MPCIHINQNPLPQISPSISTLITTPTLPVNSRTTPPMSMFNSISCTNGSSTTTNAHTHPTPDQDMNVNNNECTVREQDRFMPIANVIRIMRKILPPHAKISDDAKETIQECVSEFISFITGEANERCQREQRKTITAEDVLWAMSKLGFDDYIEPLTLYLHRYRELEGDRGSIRTCEPLLKMTRAAAIDQYAAFGPHHHVFHIPHHPHPHPHPGYFGAPNGYLKDPSPTSNSQSPGAPSSAGTTVTCFEPYGHPAK